MRKVDFIDDDEIARRVVVGVCISTGLVLTAILVGLLCWQASG